MDSNILWWCWGLDWILGDMQARPSSRFRAPLTQRRVRFYAVNPRIDTTYSPDVSLRPNPDGLLAERTVTPMIEQRPQSPLFDLGYAEIANLALLPELSAADRIRIEVTPLVTGLRFWSYVSVTNNETQHVTTISPE